MPHSVHPSPSRPSSPHSTTSKPTSPSTSTLPYWNTNLPPTLHTPTCPPFLLSQPLKNISILSTPDSAFVPQSWPQVQSIIKSNRIDHFQRLPSDLRRYLAYTHTLTKIHGSVLSYIQSHRLHWPSSPSPPSTPSHPFSNPADYRILYNDWPYGIDPEITHLVVWTKFTLEDDAETDDLTPAARGLVDKFVEETFGPEVGRENVIWFKNWASLKSVHALEHFHVMLYRAEEGFLRRVTGGDVPMAERLKGEGVENLRVEG